MFLESGGDFTPTRMEIDFAIKQDMAMKQCNAGIIQRRYCLFIFPSPI